MAALGRRASADDAVIGIVFAWILGIGILLHHAAGDERRRRQRDHAANTLFGSIYSLSAGAARLAAVIATGRGHRGVAIAARPLLLATLDAELAAVRGVPVRLLGRRRSWSRWRSSPPRAPRPSGRCCCSAC